MSSLPGYHPTARYRSKDIQSHTAVLEEQIRKSVRDPRMLQLAEAIAAGQSSFQLHDDLIWLPSHRGWYPGGSGSTRHLSLPGGVSLFDHAGNLLDEQQYVLRVFQTVKRNVRYVHDDVVIREAVRRGLIPPQPRDSKPDAFMSAAVCFLMGIGDCFTLDTQVIVRSRATECYEVRTLAELRSVWPAYDALSYDFSRAEWAFKPITAWRSRGVREVLETKLANGPSFRHTPEHSVWWYDGDRRSGVVRERALGSRVDDDRDRMSRVLVARKIPALGRTDLSRAQAYLSGIYAAEGYADVGHVSIAQDKQEIRDRIERALAEVGASYRATDRGKHNYYSLHRGDVQDWLRAQGTNSFNMRFAPSVLGGSEELIRAAYEAHADGDAYRPRVGSAWAEKVQAIHATSSSCLVAELQLMAMILGEAWHTQLQVHHGGQGDSPIYRFHRYLDSRQPARRWVEELPGVGYSTIYEPQPAGEAEVADISVEGTRNFVLANGMIAHNCDDHTTCHCTLLSIAKFRVGFDVISTDGQEWQHIFGLVHFPRSRPTMIVPLDTAAPEANSRPYAGWSVPDCGPRGPGSGPRGVCAVKHYQRMLSL